MSELGGAFYLMIFAFLPIIGVLRVIYDLFYEPVMKFFHKI